MTKEEKDETKGKLEDEADRDSGKGGSPTGSLKSNSSKSDKPDSGKGSKLDDGISPEPPEKPCEPEIVGKGSNAVVVTDLEKSQGVKLLLGPVIGHVTSTTANVLIEIDTDVEHFQMILKEIAQHHEGQGREFKEAKEVKARCPTVFHFENLPPKTAFNVMAPNISSKNIGMVRTLASKIERLNLAVVSCDRGTDEGYNHWSKLWKRVNADQLHIILHLGDNVYVDDLVGDGLTNEELVEKGWKDPAKKDLAYVKAKNILNDTPKKEWKSKTEEIREIYRDAYRKSWCRQDIRKVLATTSNLMINDDHEFRDEFGSVKDDGDPKSAEHFLGLQALRVYHEYQRQLWDPDILTRGHGDLSSEFFCLTFGSLGIMMSETRTKNSVYRCKNEGDDSYFGQKQYEAIKSAFSSNNQVKMWLFGTSMPLLFIKKRINEIAQKLHSDAEDLNETLQVSHEDELAPLLHMFNDWQRNHPGNELLILSGDVHIGGFTDIFVKRELENGDVTKELVCRQLTSSAICNRNLSLANYAALRTAMHFTEDIGPFTYSHYDWTKEYNFMVLNIDNLDFAPHYVVKQFAGEKGSLVKDSHNKDRDVPFGPPSTVCCAIL